MYGDTIHTTTARPLSNREMRRRAQEAINVGSQALLILLAVLAQSGGEITVTQGTINQCSKNLEDLDFEIVDGTIQGEFIVRLMEGKGENVVNPVAEPGLSCYDVNDYDYAGIDREPNQGTNEPELGIRTAQGDESFDHAVNNDGETETTHTVYDSGLCCMREHANAVAPWTCACLCHEMTNNDGDDDGA